MSETTAMPPLGDTYHLFEPFLGYQLRRASIVMVADLAAAVADLDLRVAEMLILVVIDANPDVTQSEIGRMLSIQRANMVPLTAVLTRRKLICRASTKGRAHALRVTPAGAVLATQCRQRTAAHDAKFLSEMSRAARARLIDTLRAIR